MLIEILREQPEYKLQVNKYLYDALAMQMHVQKERVEEIVQACCTDFAEGDRTLLVNDGEHIYSESLLRRMGRVDDISNIRREAAARRWENQQEKLQKSGLSDKQDANAVQMQSKEKKRRAEQKRAEQKREKRERGPEAPDLFADFAGENAELLASLRGFEEMRGKIKKPMTERAKAMMLRELEKLSRDPTVQAAILDQSTMRNWAGVFALREERREAGKRCALDDLRELRERFGEDGS